MTAQSGYVLGEREKLLAQLIANCHIMTLSELRWLLEQARLLNEIQTPTEGTLEETV